MTMSSKCLLALMMACTTLSATTAISCGGNFSSPSGTIQSPNYPRNYPNSMECKWDITVDPHHSVKLTFTDFELEEGYDGFETLYCDTDFVKLYEGHTKVSANIITSLCGTSMPSPTFYVSRGNKIGVRFETDIIEAYRGFKATYTTVEGPEACPPGYTKLTDHCFIKGGADNMERAKADCTEQGAMLWPASPISEADQLVIVHGLAKTNVRAWTGQISHDSTKCQVYSFNDKKFKYRKCGLTIMYFCFTTKTW